MNNVVVHILESVLQVHQFLGIIQSGLGINGDVQLFQQTLPTLKLGTLAIKSALVENTA